MEKVIVKNTKVLLATVNPGQFLNVDLSQLEYDFKFIFEGETVNGSQYFNIKKQTYLIDALWEEPVNIFIEVNEDEDKEVSFEVISNEE